MPESVTASPHPTYPLSTGCLDIPTRPIRERIFSGVLSLISDNDHPTVARYNRIDQTTWIAQFYCSIESSNSDVGWNDSDETAC